MSALPKLLKVVVVCCRGTWTCNVPKIMAQYPKTERTGSIESIILDVLDCPSMPLLGLFMWTPIEPGFASGILKIVFHV